MRIKRIFSISFFMLFIFYNFSFAQSSQLEKEIRIAVMEFKADGVPVSTAGRVSNLLRIEIVKSKKFVVLERNQMDKVLREQGFQLTGCTDETCAVQVGKILSANKILIGDVMKLDELLVISARIVDVEKGIIEYAEKQTAESTRDLLNSVQILSRKLTGTIDDSEKRVVNIPSPFQGDSEMTLLKAERTPFYPSYGAWITSVLIDERSEDGKNELFSSINIGKVWLKSYLYNNNYVYLRLKDVYMHVLKEKTADIDDSDNLIDLDLGFLALSFRNNTMKFFLGRKFYSIGTGLVFNGRGDGGEFSFYSKYLDVKLFSAYTGFLKKDNNPYALSDKDITDGARRIFTGTTLSKTILNQTIYLMGLIQIDNGKESSGLKSRYDSEYYGLGFKGIYKEAFYFGEIIHERGKSYLSGSDTKEDIDSYAGLFGLDYYFDFLFKPVLIISYSYGSGDNNRQDYKSPTGNSSSKDNGFIYFGSFIGGYGLRPVLANIHIFRSGFSISPFHNSEEIFLKRMTMIVKYSYYLKDEVDSGINSGLIYQATEKNTDIGHGLDFSIRWKMFYDLSLFCNYAIFIPGDAYPSSEKNRYFVMGGFQINI